MSAYDKDEVKVYIIPENFIDESRIIKGMFRTRNFIEGCVMAVIVGGLAYLIPMNSLTARITLLVTFCAPFFFLGVSGFNGDSIFQTAVNAYKWAKARCIVLYNGTARALSKSPLQAMMQRELPKDKILDYVEKFKEKGIAKRSGIEFVEGVNFQFEDDEDLSGCYADEEDEDDDIAETGKGSSNQAPTTEAVEEITFDVDLNHGMQTPIVNPQNAAEKPSGDMETKTEKTNGAVSKISLDAVISIGEEDLFSGR